MCRPRVPGSVVFFLPGGGNGGPEGQAGPAGNTPWKRPVSQFPAQGPSIWDQFWGRDREPGHGQKGVGSGLSMDFLHDFGWVFPNL